MKLISHDTFTYLPCKQWYLKPFTIFARCQKNDIVGQWTNGARGFDLRVWFDDYNVPTIRHGLMKFKGNVDSLLTIMNSLGVDENVNCRVILEVKRYNVRQEHLFKNFCARIEAQFPNISFYGGLRRYDFAELYSFNGGKNEIVLIERHSSVIPVWGGTYKDKWQCIFFPFPRWWAKLRNKKYIEEYKNQDVNLMIDYI